VAADPTLGEALSPLSPPILIRHCAQLPTGAPSDATSAATWTLRLLACRIVKLTGEIDDLHQQLARAVNRHTAKLLARPGVGPTAPRPCSSPPGTTPSGWAAKPPRPRCAAPVRSKCLPARPPAWA
jgi:transposase